MDIPNVCAEEYACIDIPNVCVKEWDCADIPIACAKMYVGRFHPFTGHEGP